MLSSPQNTHENYEHVHFELDVSGLIVVKRNTVTSRVPGGRSTEIIIIHSKTVLLSILRINGHTHTHTHLHVSSNNILVVCGFKFKFVSKPNYKQSLWHYQFLTDKVLNRYC